jgi:hypothetical protein
MLGLTGLVLDGVGATGRSYLQASALEDVVHLGTGLLAVVLAVRLGARTRVLKWLAVLAGISGLFLGVYGLLGEWPERGPLASPSFMDGWVVAELPGATEYPVLLLLGLWAFVCAFAPPNGIASGSTPDRP